MPSLSLHLLLRSEKCCEPKSVYNSKETRMKYISIEEQPNQIIRKIKYKNKTNQTRYDYLLLQ